MNFHLFPDLAAMTALLAILFFLHRRHPQERVNIWIGGLILIFIEAIVHAIYPPPGPWRRAAHVIALDSFLVGGGIFFWGAIRDLVPRRPALLYLLINSVPIFAVLTTYGLDVRDPAIFHRWIAGGLILGVVSPFLLSRKPNLGKHWWLVLVPILTWTPSWFAVSHNAYRDATYLLLFFLYLYAAIAFQASLPKKSLGKVAVVGGFVIWSLVFLFHSWVTNHPQYQDIADQIWDMQKFVVTIGMLLVMLEEKVSSNEWYAFHDQLTGLPNRRYFEDQLPQALFHSERTATRTALIMLDLNGFKLINDSLGHDVGDELLQHISRNLRNAIRVSDTLVRLGGDEFIIIAGDLPSDRPASAIADHTTERIAHAINKPVTISGHTITVNGSIGVAIYPDDATDEVLLRRLADQRMYEQKRQMALAF
jgi:diguanylate cyclase (GGDEF)-like protein